LATKSVETVRVEVAQKSLNPNRFATQEGRNAAIQLKEGLGHSPQTIPELVETVLIQPTQNLINGMMAAGGVPKPLLDKPSIQKYTHLIAVFADFTIIVGIVDTVATAVSATMVRKIGSTWAVIIGAIGVAGISVDLAKTLFEASMKRQMQYDVNAHYRNIEPSISQMIQGLTREGIPGPEGGLLFPGKPLPKLPDVATQLSYFREILHDQGFSDRWIDMIWNMHYIIPSLGQANEMANRGIISDEAWESLYSLNDIDPRWIDSLKQLRFNRLSRFEIRIIHEISRLTDEVIDALLGFAGYSPDMIPFMRLYVTQFRLRSINVRERTALGRLFREGFIKQKAMRTQLLATGLSQEETEAYVRSETTRRRVTRVRRRIKVLNLTLKTEKVDLVKYEEELGKLGLSLDEINDRMDLIKAGIVPDSIDPVMTAEILDVENFELLDPESAEGGP